MDEKNRLKISITIWTLHPHSVSSISASQPDGALVTQYKRAIHGFNIERTATTTPPLSFVSANIYQSASVTREHADTHIHVYKNQSNALLD